MADQTKMVTPSTFVLFLQVQVVMAVQIIKDRAILHLYVVSYTELVACFDGTHTTNAQVWERDYVFMMVANVIDGRLDLMLIVN